MKLFVVEPLDVGGMLHYVYQLSTAFADQGVQVTLITAQQYEMNNFPHNFRVEKRLNLWQPYDAGSMQTAPRNFVTKSWRKIKWTLRRGVRAMTLVREWILLTNYLVKQKPDIVQFGKTNFPFETLFYSYLRRRGLILTQICHEFELREKRGPLIRVANQLYAGVFNNFAAIFLHGERNRQRFLSMFDIPAARTHSIPHGNEGIFLAVANHNLSSEALRKRYGLEIDQPVVLFFGNLTPSKGLPDLLQAFAVVHRQNKQARLLIAGYPTKHIDINELQLTTASLGIAEATIFDARYIPMEEVGPLMKLATVAVFPYRNSSQSGALQVAYTFSRPVVATKVGGLPDAVEEGRSGLLVAPCAPDELAQAILRLVDNPDLAAEMGAYANHLSQTCFAWNPIAANIIAVYEDLIVPAGKVVKEGV